LSFNGDIHDDVTGRGHLTSAASQCLKPGAVQAMAAEIVTATVTRRTGLSRWAGQAW